MQALMMTKYGDANSSLEFQTVTDPIIGADQILIKTHAASINPYDYKIMHGDFKAVKKISFPAGIGRDVSGVVVKTGSDVTGFAVGDAVFSIVDETFTGTLAEFSVSYAAHTSKFSGKLSHEEAAGIPLAGLTSYQALVDVAKLKSGEKVLIHAGSGGVGSMAIQLAKNLGAFVATTTSTGNVQMVSDLGADQVIDYKKQNYLDEVIDFDVVFDTLGGDYALDALKVIKPGGRVVSVAGELDSQTAKELGLNFLIRCLLMLKARKITKAASKKNALYRFVLMKPDGEQLSTLSALYDSGQIKPVVDKVYAFDDSIDAFEYLIKGRAKGKVVVSFKD